MNFNNSLNVSELFFWNQWRQPYRNIYFVLLILFFIASGLLIVLVIGGNSFAYSWETLQNYSSYELFLKTIDLHIAEIPLKIDHYLVEETFRGSSLNLPPFVYVGLAVLSFVFLSISISILTTLSRFWYLFGMTIVALMLAGLGLEQLMIFDSTESMGLYIAIGLYLPLSYYFNSLNKNITLYYRILSFLLVSIVFGIVIYYFSSVENPFLYIGTYGILVPLGISLIFIFLVSHDIISGFLYVITSGNTTTSRNSFLHYNLISGLFLGWLLLTYLHNINLLDWDIIYMDPAVLLVVSGIIGIWGFRNRVNFIYPFIPFVPSGAILYLVLGITSFLTLGSFYFLANDSMLGMYEDFIVFSHLGVGFMFFLYTIGNFAGVLQKNLNVYKIQYKPKNLPYFTTSIGGIVLIGVLVARSVLYPMYQGFSGYYNALGDLFAHEDKLFLSEQYYKLARSYDANNSRSNYSLASLAIQQGDEAVALKYFDDAIRRFPNEYAYVNIGNIYQNKDRFFDALFILGEGLQKFPQSPHIQNNLGVLYSGTSVLDSAIFYLEKAGMDSEVKGTAEVNKLAVFIQHQVKIDADSLKQNFDFKGNLPLINNQLIYLNQNRIPVERFLNEDIPVSKSNIDAEAFTFWHEYSLNQLSATTGNYSDTLLFNMAEDSANAKFQVELFFLSGISQYYAGKVGAAFNILHRVENASSGAGVYNYMLGLWALDQRSYRLGRDYFKKAIDEGYKTPHFSMGVAATLSGDFEEAAKSWDLVVEQGDQGSRKIALTVKQWLNRNPINEALESTDGIAFVDLFFSESTEVPELLRLASKIEDDTLQINAWLQIFEKALEAGNLIGLNSLVDLLERKQLKGNQFEEFDKLKLEYWLASNQTEKIGNYLNDSSTGKFVYKLPLFLHSQAKQAWNEGDIEEAQNYFEQLAAINPFYEGGIIDAAEFFDSEMNDSEKAYKILLNTLNINPYSPTLRKAYILQSLRMYLTTYAENSLEDLKEVVNVSEYEKFLELYNQKKDSLEQIQNQWD